MLIKWIKKIFSDTHSAIISIIVLLVVTGTGSIYLFCKNLWHWLKTILLSQTPLWVTTALTLLVLLVFAYLYVKIAKILSKLNQPSIINPIKYCECCPINERQPLMRTGGTSKRDFYICPTTKQPYSFLKEI